MDISTGNRTTLKAYFVKNSVPKERHFAELIDGMLNQKDDGIVKRQGEPLSLEAAPDATQTLINFYPSFQETTPIWTLSLTSGDRKGLHISDGAGTSRLFIDHATGNVGIGTTDPKHKLHVKSNALIIEAATSARLYLIDTTAGVSQSDKTVDKAPAWALDQGSDLFRIIREPNLSTPGTAMLTIQASGDVTVTGKVTATSFQGSMDVGQLTTGVLALERLPELPMTKITGLQGALDGKLSTTAPVQASQLVGVLALERLPELPMTKITGLQGALDGKLSILEGGAVSIGTQFTPQQLNITGGLGFANHNATDKKLYAPADGVLEWMTHDGAGEHGFAVSHQGTQRIFLNTKGHSYLNGGNIGIGTTNPMAVFHVNGATAPDSYEKSLPIAITGKLHVTDNDQTMRDLLKDLPPYTVVIGIEDHPNGNLLFYWMGGADGKQFKRSALS